MKLKNICLGGGLIILVILILISAFVSTGDTSDQVTTTVRGVTFVLSNDTQGICGDNNASWIKIMGCDGYIESIDSEAELNGFILDDPDHNYEVNKVDSLNGIKEYVCVNECNFGYFIVFKKDGKVFVCKVYKYKTDVLPSDEFVMNSFLWDFVHDNEGLEPV